MGRVRPRRVARLVAAILAIAAGIFYVWHPPQTTTAFFDAAWPARAWGMFFFLGGAVCAVAWYTRILIIDRIGVTFLGFGVAALALSQTLVMLSAPITWTRGGGTGALWILLGFLVARWQDIRFDEQEAGVALDAAQNEPPGVLDKTEG